MNTSPGAALCILEIVSLDLQCTSGQLRTHLDALGLPLRIIGELSGYPGLVVEADDLVATRLREQLAVGHRSVEVVELRRHFHVPLSIERVVELITDCCRGRRLAIGAEAVERAAQRRRMELLVLASGLAEPYLSMVQAVVKGTGYQGPLIVIDLTRKELGHAAGVHRAGCVGVLRGSRDVIL